MLTFNDLEIDESKISRNYKKFPLKKGEYPSKKELIYLYLDLNMTQIELGNFLGKQKIAKYLHKIGIHKSKEQQLESAKRYNLRKYGTKHPLQAEKIQIKIKQTNLEKYGCENPFGNKEIQEKIKQTNLEKYGCENVTQNQEVKIKIQNQFSKHAKQIQAKIEQTNLEKYGVKCVFQKEEVKNKIKQTNLEKYGVKNPMQNKDIQEKAKQTNLEKYGIEWSSQRKDVQEKAKQTNLERYGCSCSLQNKKVQEKSKLTCFRKYGTKSATQKNVPKETLKILSSKELLQKFILSQEIRTTSFLASKLNFCVSGLRKYCHKYDLWDLIDHYTSSYELEIQELFPNTFIKTRSIIPPREIDLYSEEHKFGIEFNGNYWHSDKCIEDKNYHQKKSLYAEEKGIFLYHIFEYEWLDDTKREKIISQIRNILNLDGLKIFARKCSIQQVSSKEARMFLEENHLQGHTGSSIKLGLFYNNELISIMTFGKPRFDKSCEYELIR